MALRDLYEKLDGLTAEIRAIAENEDATDADLDRGDELRADVKRVERQIDMAKESEELEAEAKRQSKPLVGDQMLDGRITDVRDLAAEKPWGSLGEQLMAVRKWDEPGGERDARLSRAASGLNEAIPSDGGFLVQKDFASELLKRVYQTGQLANRCRRIPISGNSNGLKINAIDETSRADGSRWGGVRSYWRDEAAQYTGTEPNFRQMNLVLNKLTGLCYATDELLADTVALEAVITEAFTEEFGFKIDDAIVNGDGAGKPLGIMNAGCKVGVAKETGQAAATINAKNIQKMYARMYARSVGNAVWFVNQDCWPQIFELHQAVGTGGVPLFVPPGGISAAPYGTLMGRPIVPIEQCETLGTSGDIIFADLSQYLLIDKGGIAAAQSIHVRFVYDEAAFKFTYRVDGQPIWNSALTPFKGTATVSPIIALNTRA